jgi:hypothetical protein
MRIPFLLAAFSAIWPLTVLPRQAVCQQFQVVGRVTWQDRRGTADPNSNHAARNVGIEVCEVPSPNTCNQLSSAAAEADGRYEVTVPATAASRTIQVRARSVSIAGKVHPIGTDLSYILLSNATIIQPGQAKLTLDVTGNSDNVSNAAFSVLDALLEGQAYVDKMSHKMLPSIDVEFPTSGSASYFDHGSLHILFFDKWDWDVILHEYGHYVSKTFGLDDNPGGQHFLDENLSDRLPKSEAIRLAWGEGWPTYFSIAAQIGMNSSRLNIPNVGDSVYSDTEDASIELPLDSNGTDSLGEDNEVSVMRILFDAAESAHRFSDDEQIWSILVASHPETLSAAVSSIALQIDLRKNGVFGTIQTTHHVAPLIDESPPRNTDASPTISWTPNGGGARHRNDNFTIVIYDDDLKELSEISNVKSSPFQIPAPQWKDLNTKARTCIVRGSNQDDPPTGPFFSGLHTF